MYILKEDLAYLENKYHRTDMPFDFFNHTAYHGLGYDESTGESDEQIEAALSKIFKEAQGKPREISKATAFAYVLDHTRISISCHDFFPGIYSWGKLLSKHFTAFWHKEARKEVEKILGEDAISSLVDTGVGEVNLDFHHCVPDFDAMMARGFPGLFARIKGSYDRKKSQGEITPSQESFFQSIEIAYRAVMRLLSRLCDYAKKKNFEKSKYIVSALTNLQKGAPKTTYDALMLIYLYFIFSENIDNFQVRSLGYGLDTTLYPFYQKDLSEGVFTQKQIATFLSYFMKQFSSMGNYWGQPMFLGGTAPNGESRVTPLSYLILDVYEAEGLYNPKIQIKVGEKTESPFIDKALDMIRHGKNSIVFVNEETMIKALLNQGATPEAAKDGIIKGCYEYATKGDTVSTSFSHFNALKMVSLVLHRGKDPLTDKKIGKDTGALENFKDFDAFYAAFREQFIFITQKIMDTASVYERFVHKVNPSLLYALSLSRCAETLTDASSGALTPISSMWMTGLGTCVDALMAVRYLVYETKTVSLNELSLALDANWEGYEALRQMALCCPHKYGCGDPLSDQYAAEIHALYASLVCQKKNGIGGHFEYELHSARGFIGLGKQTEATPDGRKRGEETSKNASPTPAADKNGVTALIRSATTLDLSLADSGACLDVMMHPSSVEGEEGLSALRAVLLTYMKRGGAAIHFNIFSPALLKDAQAHPERYQTLQVRVCGWNILFNQLTKEEQDAYILRAESILE